MHYPAVTVSDYEFIYKFLLFSLASLSRIESISIISRRDKKHNKLWSEPPAMIEFIYKTLSRGTVNTGYKPRNISKSHTLQKQRYNNDEKAASSKLVGVKWCDFHKEWYIRA